MSLTEKQVEQIAYLARLSLKKQHIKDTTKDLNNILDLVGQLAKADTTGIKPMAHPINVKQYLREDKVCESDNSEQFQAIAPQTAKKHYLVPKVIK